ncbi:Fe-S cluster assembly protein SufD [Pediococcus claussenii]|uniref:FeS assembly protein SufD n=1 Tax=Pediococcus claussenii (strain ATCC BAA-344 / DSM 14800 / JCM 18046 / KCTC 3811 / LMG 21948 / P06) TaxID=701521 RepID=G8PAC4_PEDCP|nr:Fe-S cluster assembly protein SufD [Pediococcus claussenii]AEV94563.1 FeS assembly protein SufD [Pediococcus claussenii ATCC BAA-344]KRN19731.1 sufD protein [Pediococcus claussenii]
MAFKNEPVWFKDLQETVQQEIQNLKMPNLDRFDYHRWNLDQIDEMADAESSPIPKDLSKQQLVSFGDAVHIKLSQEMIDAGLVVEDFKTAFENHSDLLQRYFMTKAVRLTEDKLTALNLVRLNLGVFVYVPANVQITEPLQMLMIQNSLAKSNYFGHVLIVTERNSSLKVLQQLETRGDIANRFHLITEVVALENSQVEFTGLDLLAEKTTSYINRRGYLDDAARIDWSIGVFNDGNTIADFDSDLKGSGSDSEVKVVALSGGKQRQCIDTRVTNYAPYSTGNITQRGVILGSSELIFNGIGKIIKGAHGARANQENRVLMLSDKAHGDANPILLIDENDVLAGHAASVGRVDEHQMYYLMSRGIPKKVAQRLVIRGFLGDVLSKLPSEKLRNQMIDVIEEKLKNELEN